MQTITSPATAVRVRPIWESSELFREPTYDPTLTLRDDDGDEDDDPPQAAP